MPLDAALACNNYVGLISTRSPLDIGSKYLVYGTDVPAYGLRFPQFIGVALVVDCPSEKDWQDRLSGLLYSRNGWRKLSWIADVSERLMSQLPSGVSRNPKHIMEGRPGMILISEDRYHNITS